MILPHLRGFTFAVLFYVVLAVTTAAQDSPRLVFFGWSDQHIQTNGSAEHVRPVVEAMNQLPGTDYPETIGGQVEQPEFVFGCGDITEWPTHAARKTYEQLLRELKYPAYDVLGNHDDGGKVPSETMKRWAIAKHGGLSYTFAKNGVHFVCVYSEYDPDLGNPAQPITTEALAWTAARLKEIGPKKPVIIATHLCYDAITNKDEFVGVLKGYNVLGVLGGHYHKAVVSQHQGVSFIQLPSPKSEFHDITVLRVLGENRLQALVYDYKKKQWRLQKGVSLK